MAAGDAFQVALLLAVFAAGVHFMKNSDGGSNFLELSRQSMLSLLTREKSSLVGISKATSGGAAPQPDVVRRAAPAADPDGREMKCNEEIPAYSSVTTNNVQIFAQAFYKGKQHEEHWWMYRIEFKNVGRQKVQLLTRHWVFVDSDGKATEVKGPGARGMTPKLGPGRTHSYESGTPLMTKQGSMYGSFQFQVLKYADGSVPSEPTMFSARVGRLALSPDDQPVKVPCGKEAEEGKLPLTSVWATDRLIVGVTSSFHEQVKTSDDEFDTQVTGVPGKLNKFVVDVQVNNGRDASVTLKQMLWRVKDSSGKIQITERQGITMMGPGGRQSQPVDYLLEPNEAIRYEDFLVIPTDTALVDGIMTVERERTDSEPNLGGSNRVKFQLKVSPFGLNVGGEPVDIDDSFITDT